MNTKSRKIIADLLGREMRRIENGIKENEKWIEYHRKYPNTLTAGETIEEYEKWARGVIAKKQAKLNELYKAYQEI